MAGLCVLCGKSAVGDIIFCQDCRNKRNAVKKTIYHRNIAASREIQRNQKKKIREKCLSEGICWRCQERPHKSGKQKCEICTQEQVSKQNVIRDDRLARGLCGYCGEIAVTASLFKYCAVCYLKRVSQAHFKSRQHWHELQKIFNQQQERCVYTGRELVLGLNASLDHIIPTAAGGKSEVGNLQWVYSGNDFDVNLMKRDILNENFLQAIKLIYECKHLGGG